MNTAKGPWKTKPYTVTQGKIEEWTIDGAQWINLATVYVQEDDDDLLGAGEANARLMAAAPELLAACESALRDCRELKGGPVGRTVVALEEAIAKARGER